MRITDKLNPYTNNSNITNAKRWKLLMLGRGFTVHSLTSNKHFYTDLINTNY